MKKNRKKVLVILPPDDVKRMEEQVLRGKYVTKSDFMRIAVKQLLSSEDKTEEQDGYIAPQEDAKAITAEEILNILKANRGKISGFGVEEIGLFGSYTRNEQTPDSDIDILVVFSKGKKNFHNYMQLKLFLERMLKKKVDLVIKNAVRPELKKRILKSVVYA